MTPEEEAKVVFDNYFNQIHDFTRCPDFINGLAKRCALVHADGVLTELLTLKTAFYIDGSNPEPIQHWREVRKEIENYDSKKSRCCSWCNHGC